MQIAPTEIKQLSQDELFINWTDNHKSYYNLKKLREDCPCANCKGETILFKNFRPVKKEVQTPEMFLLKSINTVGSYAIQISWKDGHDTGIYTWEYLREICGCEVCKSKNENIKQNYQPLI
ncbi:MAG: DUF971 domain-containing protein [Ignavibacteria bacterium]|nr:DUF971 domain-containing protein [Ignavibacteria bacterium]